MNANNYQKTHWSAVEMQQREAILQLANSPHIKSENNCNSNNSNTSNNNSILINNNNNNLLCNNNAIFLQQQQSNQQIQQQYMPQLQYNNYNQQQLQQQQQQNELDFYYTPPAVQPNRQQPSHQQPQPLMPQQHVQSLNTHQHHHQQPQQQPEQHHQQQRLQLPYNSPQSLQQQQPPPNSQHQLSRYVLLQQAHRQHMLQPQHQQQQQQHQHQTHQQQHGGQQLASVDGMQSGVPTLTTPTLTPTTLRSIEETFIQITQEPSAPYQAGFIPPSFNTDSCGPLASTATPSLSFSSTMNGLNEPDNSDSEESRESWEGTVNFNEDNSQATDDTSSAATDSTSFQNGLNGLGNNSHATSNASSTNDFSFALAAGKGNLLNTKSLDIPTTTSTPRRNQGGRRPAKSTNMSPEEEEKRRVRRERNKLAAARCRKRRVDQTNELLDEVAALEKKREQLQREVEQLNTEKGDLHYLIQAHLPACQMRSHLKNAFESLLGGAGAASANTANTTNSHSNAIGGLDETLASAAGRSNSPIDLKPMLSDNSILSQIKSEPLDVGLDSNSSDGEPSPKRILRANPMIPPPLPNVATLSPSLAAAAAANSSLNTPVVTMAPVSFSSFCNNNSNTTLNALNSTRQQMKQRPNSLPMQPRNLGLNVDAGGHKAQPPTEINGVAIQTPSTGTFNYDSLMDGGTGLTPVSGPLIPTCSSQNKHPLELATPTSEPSKLVSL